MAPGKTRCKNRSLGNEPRARVRDSWLVRVRWYHDRLPLSLPAVRAGEEEDQVAVVQGARLLGTRHIVFYGKSVVRNSRTARLMDWRPVIWILLLGLLDYNCSVIARLLWDLQLNDFVYYWLLNKKHWISDYEWITSSISVLSDQLHTVNICKLYLLYIYSYGNN